MNEEHFYLDKCIVWLIWQDFDRELRESPQAVTGFEPKLPMV